MKRITSFEQIEKMRAAGEISDAEWQLIENCKAGRPTEFRKKRPETPAPDCTVQAELLRYLILGGCSTCTVDSNGVMLTGAYATGLLELDFVAAQGRTSLVHCWFDTPIDARQAQFELLDLSGSFVPELNAQGARVVGDVFFRGGFHAKGEVSLMGATIGGVLDCAAGRFENPKGDALNAQNVRVTEVVSLCDGFHATGEVSLSGATIGGVLDCTAGRFENPDDTALNLQNIVTREDVFLDRFHSIGAVWLVGGRISGTLSCNNSVFENPGSDALNGENMMTTSFFWWGLASVKGSVNLISASVGNLEDDWESWNKVDGLFLNGFRITGVYGFTEVESRLKWLRKGSDVDLEFCPQPFEEFARVLREMGHESDARRVLMDKHQQQSKTIRQRWRSRRRLGRLYARVVRNPNRKNLHLLEAFDDASPEIGGIYSSELRRLFNRINLDYANPKDRPSPTEWQLKQAAAGFRERLFWHNAEIQLRIAWMQFFDKGSRHLVGYGYAPLRSLRALIALLVTATFVFSFAYEAGDFAPNSPVILSTLEWQGLAEDPAVENPAKLWSAETGKGRDYETFNRYAYAADVVIPIINLGQEDAWAPSTTRGLWGWNAWWLRWVLTVAGWLVTAVGVAAIGRHIQQK